MKSSAIANLCKPSLSRSTVKNKDLTFLGNGHAVLFVGGGVRGFTSFH